MLMPQELRKYAFNHAIRGYSTAEVDEYIAFLCEKYEEAYRENKELERKLMAALRTLDEAKTRETQASALDEEARRVAARMLAEAERKKKSIVSDAEEYADRIIADADAHVAAQADVLAQLKDSVLRFRDDLYARYSSQIDQIEALAALAESADAPAPAPEKPVRIEEQKTEVLAEDVPDEAEEEIDEIEEIEESEESEESETAAEPEVPEVPEDEPDLTDEDGEDFAGIDLFEELEKFEDTPDETAYASADAEELAETDEALLFFDQNEGSGDDADDAADATAETDDAAAFEAIFQGEPKHDAELDAIFKEILAPQDEDTEEDAIAPRKREKAPVTDDEDEALLRDLRQAFDVHFETFTSEKEEVTDNASDEYAFLPETEESADEPRGLLDRLRGKKTSGERSDKK